jgi:uncharacterized membrane protein (DUF373 family)
MDEPFKDWRRSCNLAGLMIPRAIDFDTPHTAVHRLARRFLEPIQDLLVLAIGLALFGLMGRTLVRLFQEIFVPALDFRVVVSEVLFMLVMVEVVRLLIVYLEEHRVAVDFMVELGIVATLREIVLRGVIELRWEQVVALSVFLVALGALLRFGDLRIADPPIPEYPVRNPDGMPTTVNAGGS